MQRIFLAAILTAIFSSCVVSKKKYDDLLAQKVRMEADLAERTTALDEANADIVQLNDRLAQLKEDTTNLGIDLRNNLQKLAGLEREHDQLSINYRNLLSNSGRLNRDMAQQQQQLLSIRI